MKKNGNQFPKESKNNKTEISKKVRTNLQNAINAYLKEEKITQKDFAKDKLYISDRTLRMYISGEIETIPEQSLQLLCQVLGKSREYLLGFTIEDLQKDIFNNSMSIYMPVYKLLENVGFQFRWDEKDKCLYMNPQNCDPIPIDNNLHDFFCKQIRNYARNLFTDYYNSPHAYEYRKDLYRKKAAESNGDNIMTEYGRDPETGKQFKKTYINGKLKEGDADD